MIDRPVRRVTSADVAHLAGVSRATVSYVLNDTPSQTISAPTRARVLDAAAQLGYSPSAAARTLRSGRSDVVLCLLPDWPIGPEVGAMLGNLSTELARNGRTFVVHPGNREDRPFTDIWKAITPAAVIAFDELSGAEAAGLRAAGVAPVAALLGLPQDLVGRRQAEHLTAAGHTRLGFAWPDDPRLRVFAAPRLGGVQAACRAAGLPDPVVAAVTLDAEQAISPVRGWLAEGVTAVCAYNDEVALAVLAGARGAGLDPPTGLAVIGVDDIPPARLSHPALTTVTTDQPALAAHLAAAVDAAIAGRPAPILQAGKVVRVVARASA